MISKKSNSFASELSDIDQFSMKVRQEIVGACMELHFQELVAPPHKFDWCKWYLKGHAPVGWEGRASAH
jgi:hypothetical protein